MEYLKSLESVSIVLYSCPNFWMDDHHVSVFGTMVRFFPMFKFPNNDSKLSIMVDADTNEDYVYSLIETYNILKEKKLHKKVYLAFMGNFFHYSQKKMDEYEHNGKKYYFPYFLAQKLFSVKKIPRKPLVKFIKKMNEYMSDTNRPTNILTDYDINLDKRATKCENDICYGVDEYFLNHILVKYLLRKELLMCYRTKYNIMNYYTNPHPSYVRENKHLFYNYLKRFGIEDVPVDKVKSNEKFIETYGHKIINMIETLDKERDYRIFLKPYIYSMKSLGEYYKTYSKMDYIYFIGNYEEQISIINAEEY